jgi:hypothetical protein
MPLIQDSSRRSRLLAVLSAAAFVVVSLAIPAEATSVTFIETGTSVDGHPLSVRAVLTGTGTTLTIELYNEGPASSKATDILSSFYFDIADPVTGVRPVLTYLSGTGQAFKVTTSGTDQPVSWTPQTLTPNSSVSSNLVAVNPGDQGWQFKTFSPPATIPSTLGFGLGTVGNSTLKPPAFPNDITFNGDVVSGDTPGRTMINLGIYSLGSGTSGIVATDGIIDNFLIRNHAEFTFLVTGSISSLNPFDAEWVGGNVIWGFGTAPETLFLPEPQSCVTVALIALGGIGWRARHPRRRRSSPPCPAMPLRRSKTTSATPTLERPGAHGRAHRRGNGRPPRQARPFPRPFKALRGRHGGSTRGPVSRTRSPGFSGLRRGVIAAATRASHQRPRRSRAATGSAPAPPAPASR